MTLKWLAAVLHPRDIGSHPNFGRPAYDAQAHVRLASRLTGDPWRWSPWRHRDDGNVWEEDTLVELALASLEQPSSFAQAHELARAVLASSEEPLRRAPIALITCAVLSRLEEYDLVFHLLDQATESLVAQSQDAETSLALAALSQQRALRLRDVGDDFRGAMSAAVAHLSAFNSDRCGVFQLSPAVAWTSETTLQAIHSNLIDAAATMLTWDDDDLARSLLLPDNFELIRRRSAPILNSSNRHRGHVLSELLKTRTGRKSSSSEQDESAEELYFVNLQHELLGHGRTLATRAEFGAFCFAERTSIDDTDVIAALRHSKDDKLLGEYLEHLRRNGPLGALAQDARQIIRQRLSITHLGQPELAVLEAASELLAPPEAEIALNAILESLAGDGPANRPGHYTHSVTRRRGAWTAAANLAAMCNRERDVLHRLFQEVVESKIDDQLVDHELSEAIYALSETALEVEITDQWKELLTNRNLKMPRIRDLFLRREDFSDAEFPEPGTLEAARLAVNRRLSQGDVQESDHLAHARVVASAMQESRIEATRGHFSWGGADAGELAFFFISEDGFDWLLEPLFDYLLDPALPQGFKSQALDRMAEASIQLPVDVERRVAEHAEDLLRSPVGPRFFIQGSFDPFPAALRFLGRYSLLPDASLVKYIAELIADTDPLGRRHAARTISLLALHRHDIDFSGLAVALSNDNDLRVRSQAAVSVARYSRRNSVYRESLLLALDRLLNEDGLLAPMWMIGALSELEGDFTQEIATRLQELESNHPSRRVREAAQNVLAWSRTDGGQMGG